MPAIRKGDSQTLRQLINHVATHTNAIQALSLNTNMADLIVNHLLLSVLDIETCRDWEIFKSGQDILSTADLIKFLGDKCKALELTQINQPNTAFTTNPRGTQPLGKKVSHSRCRVNIKLQCLQCKEPHKLYKCHNFLKLQPKQRFEFVKQRRLCFNCLQPFSKGHNR
jgi:hypothetical protein